MKSSLVRLESDMNKKRMPEKISYQEMQELWDAGLIIKAHYDGAFDGWSYSLHLIGDWDKNLAWHTTERACYNAAKRQGLLANNISTQQECVVVPHGNLNKL